MQNNLAPIIAIAHRGLPFAAAVPQAFGLLHSPSVPRPRRCPPGEPDLNPHPTDPAFQTLADSGIAFKFKRLHECARIIELRQDPGDASFEKDAQDASPDLDPSPQATETEELIAS